MDALWKDKLSAWLPVPRVLGRCWKDLVPKTQDMYEMGLVLNLSYSLFSGEYINWLLAYSSEHKVSSQVRRGTVGLVSVQAQRPEATQCDLCSSRLILGCVFPPNWLCILILIHLAGVLLILLIEINVLNVTFNFAEVQKS